MFPVCLASLSVHCSLVVNWERADLLARLYVKFSCVFVTSHDCGVLGQVWYLIILIPDLCLLTYFNKFICFATFMKMSHFYINISSQLAQF